MAAPEEEEEEVEAAGGAAEVAEDEKQDLKMDVSEAFGSGGRVRDRRDSV